MRALYILSGVEVLLLGTALARLRAALRNPSKRRRQRGSRPILFDGWHLPRK
jgi:hypothetical protein